MLTGTANVIGVSEDEIAAAVPHLYTDKHNLSEGAGAASHAALLKDPSTESIEKQELLCAVEILI